MTSKQSISGTACIITGGLLNDIHAKTAHGLIRQSDRFEIVGVLDNTSAGQDAGEILDGEFRNIPVCAQLDELITKVGKTPEFAIIGMATKGGILPKELYPLIIHTLELGISIVNGLHETLTEIDEFAKAIYNSSATIYDIRKPKTFSELHFWSGKINTVKCPKIAVLGTDCALGKRTTGKFIVNELRANGYNAHMIYTGQTGWLQGTKYGFIFDSTPNDFISGELEHAILDCWKNENPDIIILEGQSSLRNPSGPCGSEYIISAELDGVILQHDPTRTFYNGLESYGKKIPPLEEEIELIKMLGTRTVAVTLNTQNLDTAEAQSTKLRIEEEIGLPVIAPLYDGVEVIVQSLINMFNSYSEKSINPNP
ncbi:MAG: DUF1611 domain-containing protein [Bacteroidota bacterium]